MRILAKKDLKTLRDNAAEESVAYEALNYLLSKDKNAPHGIKDKVNKKMADMRTK